MKSKFIRAMLLFLLIFFYQEKSFSANDEGYVFKNPDPYVPNPRKGDATSLVDSFTLDVDLTPKMGKPYDAKKNKNLKFYFASTINSNKIKTIAVYDKKKQLSTFLLDREFNLYFSFIETKYKVDDGKKISRMDLYDKNGIKQAYVIYHWQEKPKKSKKFLLRSVELFKYSSNLRRFYKIQERGFIFGGGAFKRGIARVDYRDGNQRNYGRHFYGNKTYMVSYVRFQENGDIQYSRNLSYKGGKLDQVQTYNPQGVLIAQENMKDEETGEESQTQKKG